MLSALIVHVRPQPALALTMARLVEGAVAGLLANVAILDCVGDPLAARLADEGGCVLARPETDPGAALARAIAAARADWLLIAASGLAPAAGWTTPARETMALAAAGAGFAGALFAAPRRGLLARFAPPDGLVLARVETLARARLSPLSPGRDAFVAARRAGRVRRLDGLCDDERG